MPADHDRFTPAADLRPDDAPWPQMLWPPDTGITLDGHVVSLRGIDPASDAEKLFAALDDERVWTYVAGRPANSAALAEHLSVRMAGNVFPWVVRLRVDHAGLPAGAVVGLSSFLEVSTLDGRLEVGSTLYAPAVWGSSVNPETKLLLLTYAFEGLGVGRVQLKTDVRNIRSQRAIARLGATYEGRLRRYQRRADGTVRDTALFSITAEEWPVVRARLGQRLT